MVHISSLGTRWKVLSGKCLGTWNLVSSGNKPLAGPLTRYVKLRVAHVPGMSGTISPAADFKENRYLAIPTCITARAWRTCRDACRDRLHAVAGKTFLAFPAHAHPQFNVSGKRPMGQSYPGSLSPYGARGLQWIKSGTEMVLSFIFDTHQIDTSSNTLAMTTPVISPRILFTLSH